MTDTVLNTNIHSTGRQSPEWATWSLSSAEAQKSERPHVVVALRLRGEAL